MVFASSHSVSAKMGEFGGERDVQMACQMEKSGQRNSVGTGFLCRSHTSASPPHRFLCKGSGERMHESKQSPQDRKTRVGHPTAFRCLLAVLPWDCEPHHHSAQRDQQLGTLFSLSYRDSVPYPIPTAQSQSQGASQVSM